MSLGPKIGGMGPSINNKMNNYSDNNKVIVNKNNEIQFPKNTN